MKHLVSARGSLGFMQTANPERLSERFQSIQENMAPISCTWKERENFREHDMGIERRNIISTFQNH